MGHTRPLCVCFLFFSHDKFSPNLTINDKSIDGELGTQTLVGRMVGADESTAPLHPTQREESSLNVIFCLNFVLISIGPVKGSRTHYSFDK